MAGAALDTTLNDLITNHKKSGKGRARDSGPGLACRFTNHASNRTMPYSTAKALDSAWKHDMFSSDQVMANQGHGGGGRSSSIETGTKLCIRNL